jgi:hypothetical protein
MRGLLAERLSNSFPNADGTMMVREASTAPRVVVGADRR